MDSSAFTPQKPLESNLVLSLSPSYSSSYNELQYVDQTNYGSQDRYIFASIDQKVISMSLRINFNLSPDLTLQYWGQPFIATGRYYDHKFIKDPMAEKYEKRFWTYSANSNDHPGQISTTDDNYIIDENIDGTTDYTIDKRDFNVREFLSNLVVRWEYNPGSSVFLVWSQTRSSSNGSGNLDLFDDLGGLFDKDDNKPHNIFLIKFSYRFGLK